MTPEEMVLESLRSPRGHGRAGALTDDERASLNRAIAALLDEDPLMSARAMRTRLGIGIAESTFERFVREVRGPAANLRVARTRQEPRQEGEESEFSTAEEMAAELGEAPMPKGRPDRAVCRVCGAIQYPVHDTDGMGRVVESWTKCRCDRPTPIQPPRPPESREPIADPAPSSRLKPAIARRLRPRPEVVEAAEEPVAPTFTPTFTPTSESDVAVTEKKSKSVSTSEASTNGGPVRIEHLNRDDRREEITELAKRYVAKPGHSRPGLQAFILEKLNIELTDSQATWIYSGKVKKHRHPEGAPRPRPPLPFPKAPAAGLREEEDRESRADARTAQPEAASLGEADPAHLESPAASSGAAESGEPESVHKVHKVAHKNSQNIQPAVEVLAAEPVASVAQNVAHATAVDLAKGLLSRSSEIMKPAEMADADRLAEMVLADPPPATPESIKRQVLDIVTNPTRPRDRRVRGLRVQQFGHDSVYHVELNLALDSLVEVADLLKLVSSLEPSPSHV